MYQKDMKNLKIFHPFYLPSEFVFRDYGIDTIKSKAVYILTFDETLKVNSMTESPNDLSARTVSAKRSKWQLFCFN